MPVENLIIDVKNLRKSFNNLLAVKDISIQLRRGEIMGFLGPNGAGKTTTIRMLCGLLTPDAGSGTCLGYDILKESNLIKRHVGYITQYFSLYKNLTVYENLIFIAEVYGIKDREKKVMNILDRLNFTSRQNQIAGTLSGGWKQRLSLAAALIHDPFLLLLDEPTASIDPNARLDFWKLMHSLSAEGMTILLSSHNMDEVERCHRLAYVSNGELIISGKIKEIISQIDLTTWIVKGKNLNLLAKQLEMTPGIDQVSTFYDSLHVSSRDPVALKLAITPYLDNPHFIWTISESSFQDVFVWLSKKTK